MKVNKLQFMIAIWNVLITVGSGLEKVYVPLRSVQSNEFGLTESKITFSFIVLDKTPLK